MSVEERITRVEKEIEETKAKISGIEKEIKIAKVEDNLEEVKSLREEKNNWIGYLADLQKEKNILLEQQKGGVSELNNGFQRISIGIEEAIKKIPDLVNKSLSSRVSRAASDLPSKWGEQVFRIKFLKFQKLTSADFDSFFDHYSQFVFEFLSQCHQSSNKKEEIVQTYMNELLDVLIQEDCFSERAVGVVRNRTRLLQTTLEQVPIHNEELNIDGNFDVHITGFPDGTFVFESIGLATVELKNQTMNFTLEGSDYQSASCQLAIYMKAELDKIRNYYEIFPDSYFGLLINGLQWSLFKYEYADFQYVIRRAKAVQFPISYCGENTDYRNCEEFKKIMMMLFHCISNGKRILHEVKMKVSDETISDIGPFEKGGPNDNGDQKEFPDQDEGGNDRTESKQPKDRKTSNRSIRTSSDQGSSTHSVGHRRPLGPLSKCTLNELNNRNLSPGAKLMKKLNERTYCISTSIEELLDIENN